MHDYDRTMHDLVLWSYLETTLSVINCCLPVMLPALAKIHTGTSSWWNALGSKIPKLSMSSDQKSAASKAQLRKLSSTSSETEQWARYVLESNTGMSENSDKWSGEQYVQEIEIRVSKSICPGH